RPPGARPGRAAARAGRLPPARGPPCLSSLRATLDHLESRPRALRARLSLPPHVLAALARYFKGRLPGGARASPTPGPQPHQAPAAGRVRAVPGGFAPAREHQPRGARRPRRTEEGEPWN